jgi:hypothetical protein
MCSWESERSSTGNGGQGKGGGRLYLYVPWGEGAGRKADGSGERSFDSGCSIGGKGGSKEEGGRCGWRRARMGKKREAGSRRGRSRASG